LSGKVETPQGLISNKHQTNPHPLYYGIGEDEEMKEECNNDPKSYQAQAEKVILGVPAQEKPRSVDLLLQK
jgi:hypothetical protein